MLNKEKREQLMAILGEVTEKQKEVLSKALENPISDRELFEKLGGVEERRIAEFLKAAAAQREDEVLAQELSLEELASAAGGSDPSDVNCTTQVYGRNIYFGSFPNCAATVEDGSWCGQNDACINISVIYKFMSDCSKAWK